MKFKQLFAVVVVVLTFLNQPLLAQSTDWGWPTKVEHVPEKLKFSPTGVLDCSREVYWGIVGDVNGDGWNDIAVSGWLFNRKSGEPKARSKLEMNGFFDGTSGDCLSMVANTSVRTEKPEKLEHLRSAQYVFDAGDVDGDHCDDFMLLYRCYWSAEPNEWGVHLLSGKNIDSLGHAACFTDLPNSTLYLKGLYGGMPIFYFVKADGSVIALVYDTRNPKERHQQDANADADVAVAGGLDGDGHQTDDYLFVHLGLAQDAETDVATGSFAALGRKSMTSMQRVEPKDGTIVIEVATSRSGFPDRVTKTDPAPAPTPEKPAEEQPTEAK